MKSQRKVLIFEIVLCILVQGFLHLIVHFVYADAFKINFAYLLTSWIIFTLVYWKREVNTNNPRFRWYTFIIIFIIIIIFVIFKPNISYKQGKGMIALDGYDNIYELQEKSMSTHLFKYNNLIPKAYLYTGEKNNIKYYVFLSPINGEIKTEIMGEGNYLDKYFERKYGQ